MFFTNWETPSDSEHPLTGVDEDPWNIAPNPPCNVEHSIWGAVSGVSDGNVTHPKEAEDWNLGREYSAPSTDPRPVCKFYLRGMCTAGDSCKFRHAQTSWAPDETRVCEICSDDILLKGSKYGLLENCDHVFCLGCIREWRNQKEKQDKLNLRKCPICRIDSFLIIPSSEYATGYKKCLELEAYKKTLASIPCKKFGLGDGACPFGDSCMYLHEKPDGSRFVHDFKMVQGVDGKKTKKSTTLSDFLTK